MVDMLADAGWAINRFDFGAPASNKDAFVSRGTEIWMDLARRINRQEVVLLNDPALFSQLVTRKVGFDRRGRVKLESKEELLARGLSSPDRADAVIGAFAHGYSPFARYVRHAESPWEELDSSLPLLSNVDTRHFLMESGAWPGD